MCHFEAVLFRRVLFCPVLLCCASLKLWGFDTCYSVQCCFDAVLICRVLFWRGRFCRGFFCRCIVCYFVQCCFDRAVLSHAVMSWSRYKVVGKSRYICDMAKMSSGCNCEVMPSPCIIVVTWLKVKLPFPCGRNIPNWLETFVVLLQYGKNIVDVCRAAIWWLQLFRCLNQFTEVLPTDSKGMLFEPHRRNGIDIPKPHFTIHVTDILHARYKCSWHAHYKGRWRVFLHYWKARLSWSRFCHFAAQQIVLPKDGPSDKSNQLKGIISREPVTVFELTFEKRATKSGKLKAPSKPVTRGRH